MLEPVEIVEESDSEVSIKWSDDAVTHYEAATLRRVCPCAGCVNEWTGERTLDETKIPDDISFKHTSIVGRYALNFHFSAGHDTGIFSLAFLRKVSEMTGER